MGVADTVHRSASCPPKKKWIHSYKLDEDGRDEATLDEPAAGHQLPPPPPPPLPPPQAPAGRLARSPSSFIAAHHSYVRSPAAPPAAAAPAAAAAAVEPRNGAVSAASAAPPAAAYRYDVSDDGQEKKARVSAGTREVHNKLEKNRRAHLKECFEMLRRQVPVLDDKRTSNLGILRGALRYIGTLKRKERECEHEMERLAREKIANQQRLAQLKRDLSAKWDHIDLNALLPESAAANDDSNSTLSASERLDGDSRQSSPERETAGAASAGPAGPGGPGGGGGGSGGGGGGGSPEPRRRAAERPAAASPAYVAGHSSGYSSSSPTVAPPGEPVGLARLAAMASSQQKLLVTTGHKVSLVPQSRGGPAADALPPHGEHGVYVPMAAVPEVGRAGSATVSYLEQPLDAAGKALVLETVPAGHIVNAQLMPSAGGVRLSSTSLLAPPALQVLTSAGVRLLSAPGPAHATPGSAAVTSMSTGTRAVLALPPRAALAQPSIGQRLDSAGSERVAVSGLTQLVSSSLPRLVSQPVTHLVAPASPATVAVLGQPKVVKQLPVITPYISTSSQSPLGKPMVVVTASGLVPVSKH